MSAGKVKDDPAKVKDPAKVRAGTAGMLARWGPRRIVRLDDLDPAVRQAVLTLVEAAAKRPDESPRGAE
jgi:hypothetical protein